MPGLIDQLLAAGCIWVDHLEFLPPSVSDQAPRPGDDKLRYVTGRRPVIESVVAAATETSRECQSAGGAGRRAAGRRPGDPGHATRRRRAHLVR